MDNSEFNTIQQGTAEQEAPSHRRRVVSLLPFVLAFLLLLVLLAVSIVNTMTSRQLENRLAQLENRMEELEAQLDRLQQEEIPAESAAEPDDLPESAALANEADNLHSVAHRGFSSSAPENTLPAFLLAWQKGFAYVETDIQFTADGYAVCLHDPWIDRTSNGSGRIDWMTLAQVREYDFGSWVSEEYAGTKIPTFEEFLTLCQTLQLHPYIELKADTVTSERVPALVETVKAFQMESQVSWISFSSALLKTVRECDENARIGYLVGEISYNEITEAVLLSGVSHRVFLDSSSYSDAECLLCRENNIPLEVWTLDSVEQILALDPYISGVTSNCLMAEEIFSSPPD